MKLTKRPRLATRLGVRLRAPGTSQLIRGVRRRHSIRTGEVVIVAIRTAAPTSINEYIAASPFKAQPILKRIRRTISTAAPEAQEVISYRMPAFRLHGILVYFAAFKNHIGVYPPVSGDARLEKALSPYTAPKGNLKFPLDRPIPYALIRRVVLLRVKQVLVRAAARRAKR
jgi:uncharacterized protein YdhG (YjbR/CyaY superfamily)